MNDHAVEGRLDIRFHPNPTAAADSERVQIRSSRPLQASRLLDGKTPEQALELIRLLFTLCGEAQSQAAEEALAQASGRPLTPRQRQRRDLLTMMETAREHLLRLFLDGPRLFDLDHDNRSLQAILPLLEQLRQSRSDDDIRDIVAELERQLAERVFAGPPAAWLETTDIDRLEHWMRQSDSLPARCLHRLCDRGWSSQGHQSLTAMPPLDPQLLMQRLQNPEFVGRPDWLGRHYETSCLTRQRYHPLILELLREFGTGLLTRHAARLIELASLPGRMRERLQQRTAREPARPLPEGQGLAQVEAARGRLIHAVELRRGRIERYRILAPTEWNFHPRGPVARSLSRIRAHSPGDWRRLAELIIQAIDPCVGYRLELA